MTLRQITKMRNRFGYAALVSLGLLFCLAGCATAPPDTIVVSGNGHCKPAQDLPSHKKVLPVPEVDTAAEDVWVLLATERKQHAADDRDYNSLYDTCVGNVPTVAAPSPVTVTPSVSTAPVTPAAKSWIPDWVPSKPSWL